MDKPIAWYDPTNGAVSTDKDSPLFTPLGQLLPLYTKQEDDGITLTTIRHPRGKPALGDLNPESLEQVEIDVPEPVAWFSTLPDGRLSIKIVGKPTEGSWEPLYTTTPQRTWVGLTKEERHKISLANKPYVADIMAAHEEELKRRNT
jgi:hypothetical protein